MGWRGSYERPPRPLSDETVMAREHDALPATLDTVICGTRAGARRVRE